MNNEFVKVQNEPCAILLYRQLCKVTDRHLKPFAQDAMKVSLAAQVMSNTVAAAIDTHVTAGKEKCF